MEKSIYKKESIAIKIILEVIKNICLAIVITLVISFATGFKYLNILTGSMTPTMPVGTVVVVKKIDITKVEVGDVITFKSGKNNVTHRVSRVANNNTILFTKGDAKGASEDVAYVTEKNFVGLVVAYFPNLGYLLDLVKENIIIITVCIVLALFIITYS